MNKYLRLAWIRIQQGWIEITQHKKAAVSGGIIGIIIGMLTPIEAVLTIGAVAAAILVYWVWKDSKKEQ